MYWIPGWEGTRHTGKPHDRFQLHVLDSRSRSHLRHLLKNIIPFNSMYWIRGGATKQATLQVQVGPFNSMYWIHTIYAIVKGNVISALLSTPCIGFTICSSGATWAPVSFNSMYWIQVMGMSVGVSHPNVIFQLHVLDSQHTVPLQSYRCDGLPFNSMYWILWVSIIEDIVAIILSTPCIGFMDSRITLKYNLHQS